MIVPDVNLLVYAHNKADPEHRQARMWWENLLNGNVPVGLSWVTIMGFVRIVTHPKILVSPMPVEQATATVREWLSRSIVSVIEPGSRFPEWFLRFLEQTGTGGNLTTDAYLAALTMEYQAELHSRDTDFHRFSGLKWRDPLSL